MLRFRFQLRLSALIALISVPGEVYAQTGGVLIRDTIMSIVTSFMPLWITVAILVIVIAGFTLMVSHDEGALDKAKKTIIAVCVGGVITTIIVTLGTSGALNSVYNGVYGTLFDTTAGGSTELSLQAEGIAGWMTAMAAMTGVLIIIITVLKAVVSFGGDEAAYTNVRTAVLHVIIGLVIIGMSVLFRTIFFGTGEPSAFLLVMRHYIDIILTVMTIVAVAILVYAGFRMIISFGREEDFTAAKSLMIRVVAGLVVILLSYVLVYTVALFF